MSLDNPKTVSDVFRRHGISIAIGAPMMNIQELAMAISLLGRYRVSAAYQGRDHLVLVNVWEPRVSDIDPHDAWRLLRRLSAALPTEESDQRQRELAIQDLGSIVEVLQELLREGQPS